MDDYDAYIEQLENIISEQIDSIWTSCGAKREEKEEEEREKEEVGGEKLGEQAEEPGENKTNKLHEEKEGQEKEDIMGRRIAEDVERKCSNGKIKKEEEVGQEQMETKENIQHSEQTTEHTTLVDVKHRKREIIKEERKPSHKGDTKENRAAMETNIVGELLEDIWNRKEVEKEVKSSRKAERKERVRRLREAVKPNGKDNFEVEDYDDDVFVEPGGDLPVTCDVKIMTNERHKATAPETDLHSSRRVHQDPTTFPEEIKHREKKSNKREMERNRGCKEKQTGLHTTNRVEFLQDGTDQEKSDPHSAPLQAHESAQEPHQRSTPPLESASSSSIQQVDHISSTALPRLDGTQPPLLPSDQSSPTEEAPSFEQFNITPGEEPFLPPQEVDPGATFSSTSRTKVGLESPEKVDPTVLPKVDPVGHPLVDQSALPQVEQSPLPQANQCTLSHVDQSPLREVDQSPLPQADQSPLPQVDQPPLPQADQSPLPQVDQPPLPQEDPAALPQADPAALPQVDPTAAPLHLDPAAIILSKSFRKFKATAAPPSTPQQYPEAPAAQPSLPLKQLDAQLRILFSLSGDVKTPCSTPDIDMEGMSPLAQFTTKPSTTPASPTTTQDPSGGVLRPQTPDGVSPGVEESLPMPSRSPDATSGGNTDTRTNDHNESPSHRSNRGNDTCPPVARDSPPLDLPLPSPPPSPPSYCRVGEEPLPPTPSPPPLTPSPPPHPLPPHFYCPVAEEPPPLPSTPQAIPRTRLSESTPSPPLRQDPPPSTAAKIVALTRKKDLPGKSSTAAPRRKTPPPKPPRMKCSLDSQTPTVSASHSPPPVSRKLSFSPSAVRRQQGSPLATQPPHETTDQSSPSPSSQKRFTASDFQSPPVQPQCYYLSPSPFPPDSLPSSPSSPDPPIPPPPSSAGFASTSKTFFAESRSPSSLPSSPLLSRQRTSPSPMSPKRRAKFSSLMRPNQSSSSLKDTLKEKTSPPRPFETPPPERKPTLTSFSSFKTSSPPFKAKLNKKTSSPFEEVKTEGASRFFMDSSKAISDEILSKLAASRQRQEDVDSSLESPKSILEALNSPPKSQESQPEKSALREETPESRGESPKSPEKISRSLPESPASLSTSTNPSTSEEGGGSPKNLSESPRNQTESPKSPVSPSESPRSAKSRGSEKPKFSFGSLGRKLSFQKTKKAPKLEIGYPTNFQHICHVDKNPLKLEESNATREDD